jgi:hypothetical protein
VSEALDAAYAALADTVDDLATFRFNPDEYLDSHRIRRTDELRRYTEAALVSNREGALLRVLELRKAEA